MTKQPIRFNPKVREFWLIWIALALYWIAFVVLSMITASPIHVA